MTVLPNFVIIGAPRCGTTSVFRWLDSHPDACGSAVKETFYLMDPEYARLRGTASIHGGGLAGYGALFSGCGSATVRFEATTQYLYCPSARATLVGLPTRPIVLALFREPARRVHSWFQYLRDTRALVDRGVSFRSYVDAMHAGDETLLARSSASAVTRYELQRSLDYSRYARWLEPWLTELGHDRVRTAVFESVVADPRTFMRSLATTLGISASFYDDFTFERHNQATWRRMPTLQRWAHRAASGLRIKPGQGWIRRVFEAATLEGTHRGPSDDDREVIAELAAEFLADNDALAALTGLDLSAWLSAARGPSRSR